MGASMNSSASFLGWLAFAPILLGFCIAIWKSRIIGLPAVILTGVALWGVLVLSATVVQSTMLFMAGEPQMLAGWTASNSILFGPLLWLLLVAGMIVHGLRDQAERRTQVQAVASA